MTIKKRIYLAGCMSYHYSNNEYHKATEWRSKLVNKLLDDIADKCENKWSWFDPTINSEINFETVNNATVLRQNIFYLDQSDIMVVNLTDIEHSPGSLFEIFYFGEVLKRPVIAFGESEWMSKPHVSEYITCILDEDEIMSHLDAMYYQ